MGSTAPTAFATPVTYAAPATYSTTQMTSVTPAQTAYYAPPQMATYAAPARPQVPAVTGTSSWIQGSTIMTPGMQASQNAILAADFFDMIDVNRDGKISREEFSRALRN